MASIHQSINGFVKDHIASGGLRRFFASVVLILIASVIVYFITFIPLIDFFDKIILFLYLQTDNLGLARFLMSVVAVTTFCILFHLTPLRKVFSVSGDSKEPIRPGPFPLEISGYAVLVCFVLAVMPLFFILSPQDCDAPFIEIKINNGDTVQTYSPPKVNTYIRDEAKRFRVELVPQQSNTGPLLCAWDFGGTVSGVSNKKACLVEVSFQSHPGPGILTATVKTTTCPTERIAPVIFVVQ